MNKKYSWERPYRIDERVFHTIAKDFRKIEKQLDKEGIKLANGFGEEYEAYIRKDKIWFNGRQDKDEDFETFYFPPVIDEETIKYLKKTEIGYLQTCKTRNKPYDIAVRCILIIAKKHLKESIIIDSNCNQEEWDEAKAFCEKVLGVDEM